MTRLLRLLAASMVMTLVVAACAPTAPAPPASDAAAPAKPAAAGATGAAASTPAKDAQSSSDAPLAQADRTLVVAVEGQPFDLDPQTWSGGSLDTFYFPSVHDSLVGRDPETREVTPKLAKSWEQTNDTTWRFKLQEGVTFSNGEPFTAQAVELAVSRLAAPDSVLGGKPYFQTLDKAVVVDDLTVDIVTKQPDPILPARTFFLMIGAPGWLQENLDKAAGQGAPGTGPYILAEWERDQFMRLTANPEYWGDPKPTIGEIKIVYRREAPVRATMAKTGEAHVAFQIPAEDIASQPKTVRQQTVEVPMLKLNTEGSILEDVRLRKAVVHSIDVQAITETIYSGLATPANSLVGPSAVGYNPNVPPPAYDPDLAKQLVEEAGAVGKELRMVYRIGWPTKVEEMAEAVADYISKTGLKVTLAPAELEQWRQQDRSGGPGAGKPDLFVTSHGNDTMDSAVSFDKYYRCEGLSSLACIPEFEAKLGPAEAKGGAERDKALQELWAEAVELYATMGLFSLDYVHGVSTNLEWEPRVDGYVLYNTFRFTD